MEKVFSIIMVIVLFACVLTGCSKNEDFDEKEKGELQNKESSKEMGRYVEKELLVGENEGFQTLGLFIQEDGTIDYFTADKETTSFAGLHIRQYKMNGEEIIQQDTKWVEQIEADFTGSIKEGDCRIDINKQEENFYVLAQSHTKGGRVDKACVYLVKGDTVSLLPIDIKLDKEAPTSFGYMLQAINEDYIIISSKSLNGETTSIVYSLTGESGNSNTEIPNTRGIILSF